MAIVIAGALLILVSKELIVFNAETLVLLCFASFVGRVAIRGREGVVGHFEEERKQIEKDVEAQRAKLLGALRESRKALEHLTERGNYITGYVSYYYTARECRNGKAEQTLASRVVQHLNEQLKRRHTVESNSFEQRQRARATAVPERAVRQLEFGFEMDPDSEARSLEAALAALDEEGDYEWGGEWWFEEAKADTLRYYENRENWSDDEWAAEEWSSDEWSGKGFGLVEGAEKDIVLYNEDGEEEDLDEEHWDGEEAYPYGEKAAWECDLELHENVEALVPSVPSSEQDIPFFNLASSLLFGGKRLFPETCQETPGVSKHVTDALGYTALEYYEELFEEDLAASRSAVEVDASFLRYALSDLLEGGWEVDVEACENFYLDLLDSGEGVSEWSADTEYFGDLFAFERDEEEGGE